MGFVLSGLILATKYYDNKPVIIVEGDTGCVK